MVKTWKMEHDNDAHGNKWWNIDADDRSVANVYKEEDARLIIASPDLLAACEMFVDTCTNSLGFSELDIAVQRAIKAIAIAYGKEKDGHN